MAPRDPYHPWHHVIVTMLASCISTKDYLFIWTWRKICKFEIQFIEFDRTWCSNFNEFDRRKAEGHTTKRAIITLQNVRATRVPYYNSSFNRSLWYRECTRVYDNVSFIRAVRWCCGCCASSIRLGYDVGRFIWTDSWSLVLLAQQQQQLNIYHNERRCSSRAKITTHLCKQSSIEQ